jgi:hypothetical protein
MKIVLTLATAILLTSCAGPMGLAYTAGSTGTLITTGKSIPEHGASQITEADCSVWNAIVDFAYICEYNRNLAVTYNRTAF